MPYLDQLKALYRSGAKDRERMVSGAPQPPMYLPGLRFPEAMLREYHGCGTTVHPRDMYEGQTVAVIGVGSGVDALQLAYFTRRPGGVIAIEPVAEQVDVVRRHLEQAATENPWFDPSFIDLRHGSAHDLPLESDEVDTVTQNCMFNVFHGADLGRALDEVHRVLKPRGRLLASDPISPRPLPEKLHNHPRLEERALNCCLTFDAYIGALVEAGFGAIEIRARRPFRVLDSLRYDIISDIVLDVIEVAALCTPVPADGPCIFAGRTATYVGPEDEFSDDFVHTLKTGVPLPICEKTAEALTSLQRANLIITRPTWHYGGGNSALCTDKCGVCGVVGETHRAASSPAALTVRGLHSPQSPPSALA